MGLAFRRCVLSPRTSITMHEIITGDCLTPMLWLNGQSMVWDFARLGECYNACHQVTKKVWN